MSTEKAKFHLKTENPSQEYKQAQLTTGFHLNFNASSQKTASLINHIHCTKRPFQQLDTKVCIHVNKIFVLHTLI
ncbi:Uncharacterized protein TCM_037875 [Theobroma cacao]|uniref:Uncharacterized protein n=1 Tax=Theobroma cacao TaxID=3641 RepID=A0A061GUJ3_THECC|nr:Uncharacterized protein TCM_037875 [Theobroma cacao]